jgi:hypothetical protein
MNSKSEIWSEQKWALVDIMEQYGVDVDKAGDIAFRIGNYFEDRMIELGWQVMDDLIHTFDLLDEDNNV